jgi:hypothetical protein
MAKDKDEDAGSGKERVVPPSHPALSEAGRKLPTGDRMAGRILSEEAVADEQGVKRPQKKP